jgi:hypothetical protein
MMMTMQDGTLSAERAGRTVAIQQVTEADVYRALRIFGVKASYARAVVAGLITVNVKTA